LSPYTDSYYCSIIDAEDSRFALVSEGSTGDESTGDDAIYNYQGYCCGEYDYTLSPGPEEEGERRAL